MDVNLDALTRQLAGLTGRFADLGAKLTEAAREMQDGGAPPADALVEALAAARAEFVELLAQVVATAETLGVAVPDSVESAKSLEPVLAAMSAAVDARRRRAAFDEIRSRILAIYDRVAGLLHEGDESFGPVVTLKSKAEEAKAAALALTDATTEQARALMEAAGPFADLLTMLEGTEALDDEKFSALEESVADAFGRQIAVAVARVRLLDHHGARREAEPRRRRQRAEQSQVRTDESRRHATLRLPRDRGAADRDIPGLHQERAAGRGAGAGSVGAGAHDPLQGRHACLPAPDAAPGRDRADGETLPRRQPAFHRAQVQRDAAAADLALLPDPGRAEGGARRGHQPTSRRRSLRLGPRGDGTGRGQGDEGRGAAARR